MRSLAVIFILFLAGCNSQYDIQEEAVGRNIVILDKQGKPCCSGVIVAPRYVLTAAHCVDHADRIQIRHMDRYVWGTVLFADQDQRDHDLAILELDEPIDVAPLIYFTGYSPPRGTEEIFMVGNPYGVYHYTVTWGRIAYRNRGTNVGTYDQLDISVWGGNSGCGVYNTSGQLIGILVRATGNRIAFMIPARVILPWLAENSLD